MNSPAPKVAHIIVDSWIMGGAQRNTLVTMAGVQRHGYGMELICGTGEAMIRESEKEGITVRALPDFQPKLDVLKDLRAFWAMYRLSREQRYTLVHTHSTKAGFLGRVAAWLAGVPIIVHTVHGIPYHTTRGLAPGKKSLRTTVREAGGRMAFRVYLGLERLTTLITDRLVCVGHLVEQEVADLGFGPKHKLTTIYSGIEFETLTPTRSRDDVRAELGIADRWPIVGCVGRMTRQKSQHFLLESIARLRDRYPDILLVLVGDGYLKPLIEEQVRERGLDRHVLLTGTREDIGDLLRAFDIYATPALWEGVGRALTEAMYVGLPVVATAVNGVPELVIHEETGLLVPPRDFDAMADGIDRLARDRELAATLGRNAAERVAEMMGAERMVEDTERLYRELISGAVRPEETAASTHLPSGKIARPLGRP
jgi:glycosyltransferase involved in cell wall biosynthesis